MASELEPDADAPAAAAARDVVKATIATSRTLLLAHLSAAREGEAEGVHQSRVALRRLRSDLRTFEPLLDAAWVDDLRSRMRVLAATLGTVRDDDVHLRRVDAYASRGGVHGVSGVAGVVERLQRERAQHRAELRAMLDDPTTARLLDDLRAAADDPPTSPSADAPADEVVAPLVRKRWKRLRRAVTALDDEPSDRDLHRLRIKVKQVRYASMAVAPVYGKPAARLARRLGRLQDALGVVSDAAALSARLRAITDALTVPEALAVGEGLGRLGADADAARARWPDDWRRAKAKRLRRWMER